MGEAFRRSLRSTEGVDREEDSRGLLAFLSETLDSVRRVRLSVDMEGCSFEEVTPVSFRRMRLDSKSNWEEERLSPPLSTRPTPEPPEVVNKGGSASLRLGSHSCRSNGLCL